MATAATGRRGAWPDGQATGRAGRDPPVSRMVTLERAPRSPDREAVEDAPPPAIRPGSRSPWRAFWGCWWGTVVSPVATLRRVAAEPSLLPPLAAAILFPLLYSASLLWTQLFVARTPPSWQPWVSVIPSETYNLWEAAFLVPWSLLLWVQFAAVGHLLARALGGRGTFEATLAVFAFGLGVPLSVLMWLPDLLQTIAGALWGWPFSNALVALYGTPASLWALALCALGVRIAQRLTWGRAAFVAVVAMALGYGPGVLLLVR